MWQKGTGSSIIGTFDYNFESLGKSLLLGNLAEYFLGSVDF